MLKDGGIIIRGPAIGATSWPAISKRALVWRPDNLLPARQGLDLSSEGKTPEVMKPLQQPGPEDEQEDDGRI